MYILPALVLIVCVFVCQARTDIGSLARNLTPTLHKEYVKDDKLLHLSESTCIEGACPTGLFCKDEHFCQCGSYPFDVIHCNGTISSILNHNCASFDTTSNLTQVGSCPFIYVSPIGKQSKSVYRLLPRDPRELNNAMCKPLNRTGTICGRCLPNHYPLAYSLNLTCIHCPHVRWNWARYVMAAFIPITVFYFFILAFRVNIASSHMHPVVSYCQFLSIPIFSRITFADLALTANPRTLTVAKIMLSIYGIWNLDFFRPFYTDICLGLSTLPTFALDYVVAVYPFFLMLITYLLIVLYDRNFKVVVIIWKPFQTVFSFFKEKWNIRTSVIDAFGTFFLFSNMKLLSITFDLLAPTTIFELHESGFNHSLGLYYAADIEYFGSEHLPYAILALVVDIVHCHTSHHLHSLSLFVLSEVPEPSSSSLVRPAHFHGFVSWFLQGWNGTGHPRLSVVFFTLFLVPSCSLYILWIQVELDVCRDLYTDTYTLCHCNHNSSTLQVFTRPL